MTTGPTTRSYVRPHTSGLAVLWADEVPAEVRPAIAAALEEAIDVLPRWLTEMSVRWASGSSALAEMNTQADYRRAILTVHAGWLEISPAERVEVIQHELVHVLVQPVVDVLHNVLDACEAPEAVQRFAKEQIRRAWEGATCDVTDAIRRVRRDRLADTLPETQRVAGLEVTAFPFGREVP